MPRMERPSHTGLHVELLDRAEEKLTLRYDGVVDLQEAGRRYSDLWRGVSGCSHSVEGRGRPPVAWPTTLVDALRGLLADLASPMKQTVMSTAVTKRQRGASVSNVKGSRLVTNCTEAGADLAGVLESGPAGQQGGTLPVGHCPGAWDFPRYREEAGSGRVSAHQITECQGACRSRGSGRVADRQPLTRLPFPTKGM